MKNTTLFFVLALIISLGIVWKTLPFNTDSQQEALLPMAVKVFAYQKFNTKISKLELFLGQKNVSYSNKNELSNYNQIASSGERGCEMWINYASYYLDRAMDIAAKYDVPDFQWQINGLDASLKDGEEKKMEDWIKSWKERDQERFFSYLAAMSEMLGRANEFCEM